MKLTPDPAERERLRAALDAMRVGGRGGVLGEGKEGGPGSQERVLWGKEGGSLGGPEASGTSWGEGRARGGF